MNKFVTNIRSLDSRAVTMLPFATRQGLGSTFSISHSTAVLSCHIEQWHDRPVRQCSDSEALARANLHRRSYYAFSDYSPCRPSRFRALATASL